jgi:glycosyltransferase involved in cell wall biosynthesis
LRYGNRSDWLHGFPGDAKPYNELTAEVAGRNDLIVAVGVSCVLEIATLPPECGVKVHNSRGVEPWIPDEMEEAWRLSMPRIVVGRHLVDLMRAAGSRDPIYVAHNGVDRHAYYPTRTQGDRRGVGVVYHGAEVKDPELLLAVVQRLSIERPQILLYVFGAYPKPRGLVRQAVYTRLPRLPMARDIYSRCLVWFLTSRNEGLPNPLLEALACDCAVVTTDCGGATDIIQHGSNGLIVPCGDTDAMVSAIGHLLDNAPLRKQLRVNAESTLAEFTWPRAIDAFESALLDIARQEDSARQAHRSPHEVLVA